MLKFRDNAERIWQRPEAIGEVRQFVAFLRVVKCTILTLELLSGHFARIRSG